MIPAKLCHAAPIYQILLFMVKYEVDLHKLKIERVPRLLDGRVVIHAGRRESRRIRDDVRELRILHERVPLHEVLAERLDQDVVGAERRESLGQRRRQWVRLVVLESERLPLVGIDHQQT